jgi:hypothetical protein
MVRVTVPEAKGASLGHKNLPSQTATVKQLRKCVRCCSLRSVRKTSPVSPVELQYLTHLFHDLEWSLCVLYFTADLRAASAEARSSRIQFCWEGVQF